jgi:hypothetical protein
MKKYEYKLLTVSTSHLRKKRFQEELEESFNNWGGEGWDLVKMEPVNGEGWLQRAVTTKFLIVFKREKV